ncbi:hypothetical protein HHL23_05595 [Chryseobacterium sp. RP-3-3]|uniref:Uncharacterized protein n=1 Tax=Chryseobacterium antibioticum TaxID=2728847 RepID=A0A7Y0AL29_9FLAO|nr:hypothetical protein [Chryseobacterium antibioticum]NML69266.1 hypothetical protein [Chryseobacterium antibioticum]
MEIYNSLSLFLQILINLTLITGLVLFLMTGIREKLLLLLFFLGESALELSDLIGRLLKLNAHNVYNYSLSQFLSLLALTEIYNSYFFKIPSRIRALIYTSALVLLAFNIMYRQSIEALTFYSNIIPNIVICSFGGLYFLKIIRKAKTESTLFMVNVAVFLFFSIETVISTTFNFLINNHMEWVAPIWLFRGVLLLCFYLAIVNMGCRTGKIRIWQ